MSTCPARPSDVDGYAAVLVQQSRLGEITCDELAEIVTDAWAERAPTRLVRDYLGVSGPVRG